MSGAFRLENIGLTESTATAIFGTEFGEVNLQLGFREEARLILKEEKRKKREKKFRELKKTNDRFQKTS
jgi:hypothetical protein